MFLFLLFFTTIWNGVTGTFAFQVIVEWLRGHPAPIFMLLFLLPFVLVGLLCAVALFYTGLALFNPRVEITLDNPDLALGDKLSGRWRTKFGAGRIKLLTLTLQGTEEATYTRGTTSYTDKALFADIPLYTTTLPREIERGFFEVTLPKDTMHSFDARHNKILWTIVVKGVIPSWPDMADNLGIVIGPIRRQTLIAQREQNENALDSFR